MAGHIVDRNRAAVLRQGGVIKHDYYLDFGFPEKLTFDLVYKMYSRHSVARAAITKTIAKTWAENPWLLEQERDGSETVKTSETSTEKEIRKHFRKIRFWARLTDADRMSMVGQYSAVVFRIADGKALDQPVEPNRKLTDLVEIIPVWQNQIEIKEWEKSTSSADYGKPTMFTFTETARDQMTTARKVDIHPDRLFIWSRDGSMTGDFALAPGYNDLVTMEKIAGAGGEGFWKNAKSAAVLEVDADTDITDMQAIMGVTKPEEIVDAINKQLEVMNAGFDKAMLLIGMKAKALNVSLPSPEQFFGVSLQAFAASMNCPVKIMVGMQTGERASTEDAREWSITNNARRTNETIPNIEGIVDRFVTFGMLDAKDWFVDWADLTDATGAEKIERALKMADANSKMAATGEWIFTPDEIREAVDLEPLNDEERYRDDDTNQHNQPSEFEGSDPDET